MKTATTAADCAADFRLFRECVDPDATTSEAEFNAMPYAVRWLQAAEVFASNAHGTDDQERAAAELAEARAAQ